MTLQRWNHTISSSIALIGLALARAHASFASETVVSAVNAINVAALESLSTSAPTASQRALAGGALLALRREDSKAIAKLTPLAKSRAKRAVRATAYLVLSDVYCRDQRYLACYSAIHIALELSPASVDGAYRQAMEFARAISSTSPACKYCASGASARSRLNLEHRAIPVCATSIRRPVDITSRVEDQATR